MHINHVTASASNSYNIATNTVGVNQDRQIKALQKQIEFLQKQLYSLSDNKNMSPDEIMEKRKKLQQQIQDLNRQISQRKIEIQQEKREAVQAENQQTRQENTTNENSATIDTDIIEDFINLDSSLKQVNTAQSVKTEMEGRARVLKGEIKADKSRGASTEKKEAELAELNDRINAISKDIMDKLSEANTRVKEPGDITDIPGGMEYSQGEVASEDNVSSEEHVSDEQKNNTKDAPVFYTKTGAPNQQEPEAKLSVRI